MRTHHNYYKLLTNEFILHELQVCNIAVTPLLVVRVVTQVNIILLIIL